ncbi:MAG: hypothetical protein OXM55_04880 [Bdellovibrionales bacterium]|nr:hypothetical protein [Bdellovibrionales bacterium]
MYFLVIAFLLIGLIPNTSFSVKKQCSNGFSEEVNLMLMPLEELKKIIQDEDISNKAGYLEFRQDFIQSGGRAEEIPSNPERAYEDQGWISWDDFFGIKKNANRAINTSQSHRKQKKRSLSEAEQEEIDNVIDKLDREAGMPPLYEDIDLN